MVRSAALRLPHQPATPPPAPAAKHASCACCQDGSMTPASFSSAAVGASQCRTSCGLGPMARPRVRCTKAVLDTALSDRPAADVPCTCQRGRVLDVAAMLGEKDRGWDLREGAHGGHVQATPRRLQCVQSELRRMRSRRETGAAGPGRGRKELAVELQPRDRDLPWRGWGSVVLGSEDKGPGMDRGGWRGWWVRKHRWTALALAYVAAPCPSPREAVSSRPLPGTGAPSALR